MSTALPRPGGDGRRGRSELERAADDFRERLASLEDGAVSTMVRDLLETDRRIAADLERVTRRLEVARARGEEGPISYRVNRGRLEEARRAVDAELRRFGARVLQESDALAVASAEEAIGWSRDFVRIAGRRLGLANADRLGLPSLHNRRQAEQARANLVQGSPLRELLDTFGERGAERVAAGLIEGAALGRNPDVVARRIRSDVVETYRGRARLIARTEAQRTVRAVTADRYAADDVVSGWRWFSSRDRRTCPACWAEHGGLHPADQPLYGHPGCRCVMVPVLRAETRGPGTNPSIPPGEELFAELSPDDQLAVLGPAKLEALQRGEVRLRDFSERVENPRWGPMTREASLERARAAAGRPRPAAEPDPIELPDDLFPDEADELGRVAVSTAVRFDDSWKADRERRDLAERALEEIDRFVRIPPGIIRTTRANQYADRSEEDKKVLREHYGVDTETPQEVPLAEVDVRLEGQLEVRWASGTMGMIDRGRAVLSLSERTDMGGEYGVASVFRHEMGHYLDNLMARIHGSRDYHLTTNPLGAPREIEEAVARFQDAARRSGRIRSLLREREEIIRERDAGIRPEVVAKASLEASDYILEPREIWARAFNQYIGTRAGTWQTPSRSYQWRDEDFGEVAEALEGVLRAVGWLR